MSATSFAISTPRSRSIRRMGFVRCRHRRFPRSRPAQENRCAPSGPETPTSLSATASSSSSPSSTIMKATYVGADATLVPLQAPAGDPRSADGQHQTDRDSHVRCVGAIRGPAHLVFGAADVDATVTRLAAAGVVHGPINHIQRPGSGADNKPVSIDFVEIDDRTRPLPEGRLALVEDWPEDSPLLMKDQRHPNGASGDHRVGALRTRRGSGRLRTPLRALSA